jgi:hypothetical protein
MSYRHSFRDLSDITVKPYMTISINAPPNIFEATTSNSFFFLLLVVEALS